MSIWGWGSRRRAQVEREVREEIVFYLEMRAQEFERQGMEPEEAMLAAVRAFGDPGQICNQVVREVGMRSRWTQFMGSALCPDE